MLLCVDSNIALADSVPLLRLWRWLHARRRMRSVLAGNRYDPDALLLRRLSRELVARGLL